MKFLTFQDDEYDARAASFIFQGSIYISHPSVFFGDFFTLENVAKFH
jgi:hypothetical protein